jgi:hypothetical protein
LIKVIREICKRRITLANFLTQHNIIRLIVDVMNINVTDDAGLVDEVNGAFGVALSAQDAISFRYSAMGPEVAEQGIINSSQAFSPCTQTIG